MRRSGVGDLAVDVADRLADALAALRARRRRAARPPRARRSRRPTARPPGPRAPDSSTTSTSTVGLPRESRIWRACTRSIWLTGLPESFNSRKPLALARSASSGSARIRRATSTAANSSSPSATVTRWRCAGSAPAPRSHPARAARRVVARLPQRPRRVFGLASSPAADRIGVAAFGRRAAPAGSPGPRRELAAALLLALDLVPVLQHLSGCLGLGLAEYVRMAADQLLAAAVGDRARGPRRRALRAAAPRNRPGRGRRRARRACLCVVPRAAASASS